MINQNSAVMPVNEAQYRARVMGCWLGKAVGGTLGLPFEGMDGPFDLSFYEPVPTEMLPNDDLDLQVVWACKIDGMAKPTVDRHVLARAWQEHVNFPWDEYGVALRNMANGLQPPLSGSHDNWFADGMGASIRSEIWACLAPGNPALAAAYAYEDACVDHAGEGIWGEVFLAALESMAFTESRTEVLLKAALDLLPVDSRVYLAVRDTQKWWQELHNWRAVREAILRVHGHENFTDAPMNIAFTVLGWLAGEGDFGRTICIATNCGKDTDCTGATAGALMGILNPDCISQEWLAPIGRDLVLSPGIGGLLPPKTLNEFTDLVIDLRQRLGGQYPNAEESEQSVEALKVPVAFTFVSQMPTDCPLMDTAESKEFDGTFGQWKAKEFEDEYLLLEYRFHISEDRAVEVLFNTPQSCRVWFDGEFLLERDGGVMAPSFHRAPARQLRQVELEAGNHTLIAALKRPADNRNAEWVTGIGDAITHQWIADAHLLQGVEI